MTDSSRLYVLFFVDRFIYNDGLIGKDGSTESIFIYALGVHFLAPINIHTVWLWQIHIPSKEICLPQVKLRS